MHHDHLAQECTKLDSISPLPPPLLPKTYNPPHDVSINIIYSH